MRRDAMTALGNGLFSAQRFEDALSVREAELSMERRLGASEDDILVVQTNLATCLNNLGRLDEALAMERDVYSRKKKVFGLADPSTIIAGNNLVHSLIMSGQYAEAKTLSRKLVSQCRRVLGPEDNWTLYVRQNYAETLYKDTTASRADILQGVVMIEDVARVRRRVFGPRHPDTVETLTELDRAGVTLEDAAVP